MICQGSLQGRRVSSRWLHQACYRAEHDDLWWDGLGVLEKEIVERVEVVVVDLCIVQGVKYLSQSRVITWVDMKKASKDSV